MDYQGNIFRPPSEANSILLQVTTGCSHNKCTFCDMYKGSLFSIKSDETIMADIDFAKQHCKEQNRLFICDGDALIVPQKRLLNILGTIKKKLPWLNRIGIYANAKSIAMKAEQELLELHQAGLDIAYMGVESGDDVTLKRICKGADSKRLIEMGQKLAASGMTLSLTVLIGVAGRERSLIHARETGRVLTAIDPKYVGGLSLMLNPGTPLCREYERGEFQLPNPMEMLAELRTMIEHTELTDGSFHANHASNYFPVKARLPKEKSETIRLIDRALNGDVSLKPDYLRAF
ncbi:radical SAM protein [Desulfobulbus rhabdoformis]|uniref:radical SAM protein n=1 Tax=Desulfobulbus rhabdoformis TaxID=34032 RepID=UPI0019665F92|nr:radical SAM protein [Desulfobulbus rhabdoformis]MBM9614371.1 radical SAM protein [Desulfobulbus rhabdoformis]